MTREGSWWRLKFRDWKVLKQACSPAHRDESGKVVGGMFERAGLKPYEADVNPVRRFLTDNNVHIQKPKRCYVDLEVDSRQPIIRQIEGKARILCWSLVDEEGNKLYGLLEEDTDDAEALMLGDLWTELLEYDQVCSWNQERYDKPCLNNRSEALGIKVDSRRWLWCDHMIAYGRYNMNVSESGEEKESLALGRVAQAVLGRDKLAVDTRESWEIWQSDPMRLVDYCIEDSVLEKDIEAATGYLDLSYTVCEVCTTLPDTNGVNPTNFVEGYMLKLGLQNDTHFDTMYRYKVDGEGKFEGAYVMEPTKTGLLKDVHVCDFSSLYPSIILSWNMSPETLSDHVLTEDVTLRPSYLRHLPVKTLPIPEGHCEAPITGKVFRTNTEGLLPKALAKLLELRNFWKKKKSSYPPGTPEWKEADRRAGAYKIAANSFYGVQGSIFSRFHVRAVAESIAQAGKWLILETMKAASEKFGFQSVYSDTDSLFIVGGTDDAFQTFVDWCNAELYPKLLASKKTLCNKIKLGYEKKFERLILVRKKRYAGKYAHFERTAATADSKPEIKGLEIKRGDTLKLARDMQREIIQMLLYDEIEVIETYREFLLKWRTRILNAPLKLEDVRQSNSLGKDIQFYHRKTKKDGTPAALPPHVEVAIKLAATGADIAEGVRIEYFVVDGRSPMTVLPASEYDGTNVDRYFMWESQVYPPSMRILDQVFRGHKWKSYLKVRPTGKGRGTDNLGQGMLF